MSQEQRTKIWIDHFQTRLTVRIGLYLIAFLVVLVNFLFALTLFENGTGNIMQQFFGMLRTYLPVWICLFLLVPVIAWDAVRFTHRLVGPMVRFRRALRDIKEGTPVRPIKLRDGDFLNDMRDDFNDMLLALERRGVSVLKPLDPGALPEQPRRTSSA